MNAPARLLRSVNPAPRLYFRAGHNDHTTLLHALAGSSPPGFQGVVMDASTLGRHTELRLELRNNGVETVLDPMCLELATDGGWSRARLRGLEWAGSDRHEPSTYRASGIAALSDPIAKLTVENRFDAVLAPSHFLSGIDDPWWKVDRHATARLRHQLDSADARDVPIYFRLAISRKTLLNREERFAFAAQIADMEIDALWLCLHPVSAHAGPDVLKSYLELCRDLSAVGIPLVAERTGFFGVVLAGFNAVGGIESGVAMGEGFDVNRLVRPPKPSKRKGFSVPRVYLERMGVYLSTDEARKFLDARGMKRRFACQDRQCCRVPEDMLRDPRRHFLHCRTGEVGRFGRIPFHDRPTITMDSVRNASDDAVHAANFDSARFEKERKRLSGWRTTLAGIVEREECAEKVIIPDGHRFRRPNAA